MSGIGWRGAGILGQVARLSPRSLPMSLIRFLAMPTAEARGYQRGGPDAYGNPPERGISDGSGLPCRHCLRHIAVGEPYLTLAHRPFPKTQPYAETGPIFLHADECERAPDGDV